MSGTTTSDYAERLSLAEQVARIERGQEEVRKFVAERDKLLAEREKLSAEAAKMFAEREKLSVEAAKMSAEREKLSAEAAKMAREARFVPWLGMAAVAGAAAAVATILLKGVGLIS